MRKSYDSRHHFWTTRTAVCGQYEQSLTMLSRKMMRLRLTCSFSGHILTTKTSGTVFWQKHVGRPLSLRVKGLTKVWSTSPEIAYSLRKIISSPSKRFRLMCYTHSSTGSSPFVKLERVRLALCKHVGMRFASCERKMSRAVLPARGRVGVCGTKS